MTLEERIDKERETNDGLAREIEKLIGESLADFRKSLGHAPYLVILQRPKRESDERLTSLRQQMQFGNETGPATSNSHEKKRRQKTGSSPNPEVLKRRGLVNSNPNVPAKEMCEIFDRENVPLPSKWQEAGFRSWIQAYKNPKYGSRIRVIIWKDRQTA